MKKNILNLLLLVLLVSSCKRNVVNVESMETVAQDNLVVDSQIAKLIFDKQPVDAQAAQVMSSSIVVKALDSSGKLLENSNATVSLDFAQDPSVGKATILGTITVVLKNGSATFSDISIDKAFNNYKLLAKSGDIVSEASESFNITVGTAKALVFEKTPKDTVVNYKLNPQVKVHIVDAGGNIVTSANNSISISHSTDPSGSANMSGTLTKIAVSGVATFDDLIIDKIAQGHKLSATAQGLSGVESEPFSILKAYSLSSGFMDTCVNLNGSVKCFGQNAVFELGNGTDDSTLVMENPSPTLVLDDTGSIANDISKMFFGRASETACAILNSGEVRCMGRGANGQRGDGTLVNTALPTFMQTSSSVNITDVKKVAVGLDVTCAITNSNTLMCMGKNDLTNHKLISDNSCDAFATVTDCNANFQCGWFPPANRCFSKLVIDKALEVSTNIQDVTVGKKHICIKDNVGDIKCWGENSNGQLGNGNTTDVVGFSNATTVSGLTTGTVSDIQAGCNSTCALLSDKTVKCWGQGNTKNLGRNSTNDQTSAEFVLDPSGLLNLSNITKMAVGCNHSCFVKDDGNLFCVGDNSDGQLGEGVTNPSLLVVENSSLSNIIDVTVGDYHTCALNSNNEVFCWGANYAGESGHTGDTTATPTQVLDL